MQINLQSESNDRSKVSDPNLKPMRASRKSTIPTTAKPLKHDQKKSSVFRTAANLTRTAGQAAAPHRWHTTKNRCNLRIRPIPVAPEQPTADEMAARPASRQMNLAPAGEKRWKIFYVSSDIIQNSPFYYYSARSRSKPPSPAACCAGNPAPGTAQGATLRCNTNIIQR